MGNTSDTASIRETLLCITITLDMNCFLGTQGFVLPSTTTGLIVLSYLFPSAVLHKKSNLRLNCFLETSTQGSAITNTTSRLVVHSYLLPSTVLHQKNNLRMYCFLGTITRGSAITSTT